MLQWSCTLVLEACAYCILHVTDEPSGAWPDPQLEALSIQRVAAPAYLDILQVGPELQVFCPDTCNAGNDQGALAERPQRPFDNVCTAVAIGWQGLLLALSASAAGH